jgi:4-aminobutyrate aminotransferase-like enzyme
MNAYSVLLSTGAEAVEFCIRYAKHIKGKNGIVCYDKGYHGLTLGAQSVTYSGKFAMPRVEDIYPIKVPDTFITDELLDYHIEELDKLLKEKNSHIAAVLMEPIVSVGGMILPPQKWYIKVRQLCDEYDVILIFDESQTGFGRLGKWFAYQHYDVIPDMVAIAKGLGQGYPVSGVLLNEKIIPDQEFSMTHYSSHQNDAFAANIINIGIEYIDKNNILSKVIELGEYFKSRLLLLQETSKIVCKARGCGLMLGLDLYFDGVNNYREIYKHLSEKMTDKGVIIQGTNGGMTLRFLPDYLISKESIDLAIDTLEDVLKIEEWEKYI